MIIITLYCSCINGRKREREKKIFPCAVYAGFMWMLLLVAYGQRDPNAYYLTKHIQQSFSTGITDSMTQKEVFTWANTSLLNSLFGQYPGKTVYAVCVNFFFIMFLKK